MSQNESSSHPIFVLLVDDEPSQLEMTQLGLRSDGNDLTIITASSARQALDLIHAKPFDCIVSDYVMPGMNGLELCAKLRAEGSQTPFILFTGQGSEEVAEKAFSVGVDDYLRKEQSLANYRVLARNIRNLVEKHRAEEEARLIKVRLDSAFLNSPVVAFGQDLNLRYTWIYNPNMSIVREQTIGKTDEELIGSQGEQLTRAKRRVLETGVGERVEFELTGEGGRLVYDTTIEPTRDRSGRITGIVSTAVDITDRRRVEKALRESEERHRIALKAAKLGTFDYDLQTKVVKWDDETKRMCGIPGKPDPDYGEAIKFVYPEDREKVEAALAEALEPAGDGSYEAEFRIVRPDGSVVWNHAMGKVYFEGEGSDRKAVRQVGVNQDITDRKNVEVQLRESERKFRMLAENAPDAIMRFDTDLRVLYLNPNNLSVTGRRLEEFLGRTNEEMGMPAELCELWNRMFDKARTTGKVQQAEFDFNSANGLRTFSLRIVPEFAEDGSLASFLGISRDVTELKRAEVKLRESEGRARRHAEELETVLRVIPSVVWMCQDSECNVIVGNTAANRFFEAAEGENVSAGPASGGMQEITRRFFRDGVELRPEELPMQMAVANNTEIMNSELEVLQPSGGRRTMLGSVIPLRDEGGRVRGCVASFVDISERKSVEDALRESEKRYRQIVENTTVAIYEVSLNGDRFISVNDATTRILGYSREELLAMSPASFGDDESRAAFAERIRRKLAGEPIDTTVQYTAVAKDGSKHTVLLNDVEFTGKDGRPESVVVIATDITDRVRAERALRESESSAHSLVSELVHLYETVPGALCIFDRDLRYVRVNRMMAEINGHTVEEHIGKTPREVVPDLAPLAEEVSDRIFRTGEPVLNIEFSGEVASHPGVRRHWLESWYPIKDGRQVVAISVVAQEITELKKAEEALRESEGRYRLIYESSMDAILITKPDGNILSANPAAQRMLGMTEDEIRAAGREGVVLRDEKLEQALEERRTTGSATAEFTFKRKNGSTFKGELTSSLFTGSDGVAKTVMIVRDVTERVRAEEQLMAARDELQEYASRLQEMVEERTRKLRESEERLREAERGEAIEKVSAMVAHDIRSPINTASQALQMARRDPAKAEKLMGLAEKSLGRAVEMIEALRESTRLIEPKLREVNLRPLVEDTIREMPTGEKVLLESSFGEGVDVVRVDPALLRRVLENLIQNAGDAMPNGGRVRVGAWRDGRDLVLSVADSGVGIPGDVAGKVFTPLFTTKVKGVGLGLSFCKRAVEAQGGTIGFSSRVGEGTTFTVRIPVG